jgi:hypothetical protein
MHILLVEPAYYSRYPPLALLKLASYHRVKGDTIELVKGCTYPKHKPDLIYVTSLFTWAWRAVWTSVRYYKRIFPDTEVWLGGIYASLLPRHAEISGADQIYTGIFEEAENLMPAYDLIPEWDGSIVFASRGCNRRCPYCAVWQIEGKINSCVESLKHMIYPAHTRIILWDNNILQSPYWYEIFEELVWFGQVKGIRVDFNQGLDARLITDESAERMSKMKLVCVRISFDSKREEKYVKRAIEIMNSYGIRGRKIGVYVLFNYSDTPDDFFERVRNILNWGAVAFPMRYQPLDTLEYNKYVGDKWDEEKLSLFAKFRRVCGYGGAFPPYKWLVEHFNKASSFEEAFQPPKRNPHKRKRAHKDYFASWRRVRNWREVVNKFSAKRW